MGSSKCLISSELFNEPLNNLVFLDLVAQNC
jgi:hypothetical protein